MDDIELGENQVLIKFCDLELVVTYDYQPQEEAETGPEAQYPGLCERLDIEDVEHCGQSVFDLLETMKADFESIDDAVMAQIKPNPVNFL